MAATPNAIAASSRKAPTGESAWMRASTALVSTKDEVQKRGAATLIARVRSSAGSNSAETVQISGAHEAFQQKNTETRAAVMRPDWPVAKPSATRL